MKRIIESFNSLTFQQRRWCVLILVSVLCLLICLPVLVGPSVRHGHTGLPVKNLKLEVDSVLLSKPELLEKKFDEFAAKQERIRKAIPHGGNLYDGTGTLDDTFEHFGTLSLRQMADTALIALFIKYDGLTALEKKGSFIIFWCFWLMCGVEVATTVFRKLGEGEEYRVGNLLWQFLAVFSGMVGLIAVVMLTLKDECRKVYKATLFTVGEPPFRGMLKRLKESLRGCGHDKLGSLYDTADIFREKEMPDLSEKPERKWHDGSNWISSYSSWIKNVDPWSGASWEDSKLSDGASLADLMDRILETADRRSQPSMRFYLSTVLKAHMFLLNKQVSSSGKKIPYVRFNNLKLRHYYEFCFQYAVDFETDSGNVILDILKMLDEHGECPSVARITSDRESRYDQRSSSILKKVPLWRHSLNVANSLTSRCAYQGEPLSRLLIASLAHDLGKIPHMHNSETESHVEASVQVLNEISGFTKLLYAGDIRKAIREHHDNCPATSLGKMLCNADHGARRHELTTYSVFEYEKWEMGSSEFESSAELTMKNICRAIYPYFMEPEALESLRDSLTTYDRTADLVKDLERILRQPQFLFNDAFRVGAAITEIAGAKLR